MKLNAYIIVIWLTNTKYNLFMKKKWSLKPALFLVVLTMGFVSCSDDDSDAVNEGQNASITVRMTDAPGEYDGVFVDVQDVMVQTDAELAGEEADEEGWISLDNVQAGRYDLLELTGGVSQLLAEAEIPAGNLGQIRLLLGNDNTVVIDGEEEPLATPSAQQSGLKLNVGQDLEAGEEYEFLLDFDVDESIVETGNGGYILNPTIRLSAYEDTGMIVGEVHPTNLSTLIRATNGTHTISAYTDESGAYTLHAVPAGTYKVTIITELGLEIEINDVEVEADGTIDLETTYLEE